MQGAEHTYTIALLFSGAKIRYLLTFQLNHQETFGQSLFGHHMKKTILLLLQEIVVQQLGNICLTQDDNLSLDLPALTATAILRGALIFLHRQSHQQIMFVSIFQDS